MTSARTPAATIGLTPLVGATPRWQGVVGGRSVVAASPSEVRSADQVAATIDIGGRRFDVQLVHHDQGSSAEVDAIAVAGDAQPVGDDLAVGAAVGGGVGRGTRVGITSLSKDVATRVGSTVPWLVSTTIVIPSSGR